MKNPKSLNKRAVEKIVGQQIQMRLGIFVLGVVFGLISYWGWSSIPENLPNTNAFEVIGTAVVIILLIGSSILSLVALIGSIISERI